MIALPRLLWLVAFPLEAAAGWLLFGMGGLLGSVAGVALHVLAAGLFGLSLLERRGEQWTWAWPVFGLTIALFAFPLLGMAAVLVGFVVAHIKLPRRGAAARAATATDMEEHQEDAVARAHELEVALLDELEIEPVVDVLREDDAELKRAAIEVIAKQGDSSAVRLLIGLLHDPSPEARFFASLGLSKLEDAFGRSILAAQRVRAENPDSPEAREAVAQLYLDYAISGFLEGVTRDYYLDLARQAFEDALEISRDPDMVRMRLARVHLLLRQIADAAAILDELVRRRPTDPDLHLLRMEVIYQFGDLRELVVYARRAAAGLPDKAEARELVEWWAQAGRREEALAV